MIRVFLAKGLVLLAAAPGAAQATGVDLALGNEAANIASTAINTRNSRTTLRIIQMPNRARIARSSSADRTASAAPAPTPGMKRDRNGLRRDSVRNRTLSP